MGKIIGLLFSIWLLYAVVKLVGWLWWPVLIILFWVGVPALVIIYYYERVKEHKGKVVGWSEEYEIRDKRKLEKKLKDSSKPKPKQKRYSNHKSYLI